nr:hypothetical protein Iba_chr02dCG1040 [Ipomoea batatas]
MGFLGSSPVWVSSTLNLRLLGQSNGESGFLHPSSSPASPPSPAYSLQRQATMASLPFEKQIWRAIQWCSLFSGEAVRVEVNNHAQVIAAKEPEEQQPGSQGEARHSHMCTGRRLHLAALSSLPLAKQDGDIRGGVKEGGGSWKPQ